MIMIQKAPLGYNPALTSTFLPLFLRLGFPSRRPDPIAPRVPPPAQLSLSADGCPGTLRHAAVPLLLLATALLL